MNGVWIFRMVEKSEQRTVYMIKMNRRRNTDLIPIIEKKAIPGSIIHSDMWRSYNRISRLGLFYTHQTVNHSRGFVNPETGVHTNTIEANWSALKRDIPPNHRRKKYIDIYLGRFMWMRNTGKNIKKILDFIFNTEN